jgi:hypothetical protein
VEAEGGIIITEMFNCSDLQHQLMEVCDIMHNSIVTTI